MTERERGTSWAMGLGEIGDGAWGGSEEPIGDEGAGDGRRRWRRRGLRDERDESLMREVRANERTELKSDEERDHGEI